MARGRGWIWGFVVVLAGWVGCGVEEGEDPAVRDSWDASDVGGWDSSSDGPGSDGVWPRDGADADADADAAADTVWDGGWDAYDASVDASAEATVDGVEPGPDGSEDAAEEVVEPDLCAEEITEPQVLYLSADDSNSQASPVVARALIRSGALVAEQMVRTYEFLNYYDISYDPPAVGHVTVRPQLRADLDRDRRYTLQIGVQGHPMTDETRRPMVLTLVLDTSGSMSGTPIALEREVVLAIASSLRAGDVVSAVEWNTARTVRLDGHRVTGPDDPTVVAMARALESGGGTDLDSGLRYGYDLATRHRRAGALNRVILVSDGQANVGVTSAELIVRHAADALAEGIYLVGVGCGNGYNDTLMDEVTDQGKGAYLFIDSADEARRMFVDRFYANLEIAVMDVRVELTLPPEFRMEEFHGEEYSTVPEEVDPQHLAPNDAMVFHQYLHRCPGDSDHSPIRAVAEYTDPVTRTRRSDAFEASVAELLESPCGQLFKGNAIVAYAEGLKKIYRLLRREGDRAGADAACTEALHTVSTALRWTGDPELREIESLLRAYCADLVERHDAW